MQWINVLFVGQSGVYRSSWRPSTGEADVSAGCRQSTRVLRHSDFSVPRQSTTPVCDATSITQCVLCL